MMSTDCRPLQMEPFLSARFSHKKYRGNKQKKAMSGFLVGGTAIDLVGVEVIFMNLLFASKLPFSNLYDRIVLIITAWDNEVTGTAFDTSMIPSTMDHGMPLLAQKKRCTHVTISCSCGHMPGYAAISCNTFYRTYWHQVYKERPQRREAQRPQCMVQSNDELRIDKLSSHFDSCLCQTWGVPNRTMGKSRGKS